MIDQVMYSNERPVVPNKRPTSAEAFKMIFTKSLDWEYEQEVRVVSTLKDATKTVDIKPFKLSLFHVPHEAIGEIIIGLRSNKIIYTSASKLAKKLSVPIYKADISKRSFDLERVRVSA